MRKLLLALVKAKRITALVGTVAALALAAAPGNRVRQRRRRDCNGLLLDAPKQAIRESPRVRGLLVFLGRERERRGGRNGAPSLSRRGRIADRARALATSLCRRILAGDVEPEG